MSDYLERLFGLKGRTVLAIGASRGLGHSITLALAKAGADIVLGQRDPNNTTVLEEIKTIGVKCHIVECDFASSESVKSLVTRVTKGLGIRIDVLMNSAGIQRRNPVVNFTDQEWDDVLQVNLTSAWTLTRDCGRHMLETVKERPFKAKIINIASVMSYQAGVQVPAYVAAKHGLLGLTKACSNEWATNICVNCISPGYVTTDLTAALQQDQVRYKAILDRTPAGRWATTSDFDGAAVFLSSSASDYVTGESLVVDGGWLGR